MWLDPIIKPVLVLLFKLKQSNFFTTEYLILEPFELTLPKCPTVKYVLYSSCKTGYGLIITYSLSCRAQEFG